MSSEIRSKRLNIGYIKSIDMAADVFTKFYPKEKREIWRQVCNTICVFSPEEAKAKDGLTGNGYTTAVVRF